MVADFPLLTLSSEKVTILSSPIAIRKNNFDSIFEVFQFNVWILILLSYLIIILINIYKSKSLHLKIYVSIDYLSLLIGQSIGIHKN
jgi:hypothetical protein